MPIATAARSIAATTASKAVWLNDFIKRAMGKSATQIGNGYASAAAIPDEKAVRIAPMGPHASATGALLAAISRRPASMRL